MESKDKQHLSVGEFAQLYPGLQSWQVRRIYERKLLPEPIRIGTTRAIPLADIPKVIEALETAGLWPRNAKKEKAEGQS